MRGKKELIMKHFSILVAILSVLMLCLAPLACSSPEVVVDEPESVKLNIGMTSSPNTLVPMKSEKLIQASLAQLIWEPLVRQLEDGTLEPCLAASWDVSEDKLEYTFYIDPDAAWSDGNPVTAEDVKYSFEVGKRHHGEDLFAQTKKAWAQIDSIEVVEDEQRG